jgi:hypothetical protein
MGSSWERGSRLEGSSLLERMVEHRLNELRKDLELVIMLCQVSATRGHQLLPTPQWSITGQSLFYFF